MKKRIHIIALVVFIGVIQTSVKAQINVPDANFKSVLLSNSSINTNMNGEIEQSEAIAFNGTIAADNLNIADLTGIEEFINLSSLYVNNNLLTTLDLSANTQLMYLNCSENQLTSLDVSGLVNMTDLYCSENSLATLDLPLGGVLSILDCSVNNLTVLDFANSTSIYDLNCSNNSLANIYLTNCTNLHYLNCSYNLIQCLDVSGNTNLQSVNVSNNSLEAFNIKNGNNTDISYFDFYANNNPSLVCVQVDDTLYAQGNWTSGIDNWVDFNTNCGIPQAGFTTNAPVCIGSPVIFTDTSVSPYLLNYVWDFGDGDPFSFIQNPVHTYTGGGDYFPNLTVSNCYGSSYASTNISMGVDITGDILASTTVDDGFVMLFKFQPGYIAFDTIANEPLEGPSYYLGGVGPGEYLVKIIPNPVTFPDLLPTYHYSEWAWDSADVITVGCVNNVMADVNMIPEITLTTGVGLLHGQIIEGPGYGRAQGDPVHGVDVKLGITATSQLVGNTTTDNNGEYSFGLVPFGTYTIFVDIPGLLRDSSYTITIDSSNYEYLNLDYIIDSSKIFIVNPIGIEDHANQTELNVFPNPAKDQLFLNYVLSSNAKVKMEIYNLLGTQVRSYINSEQAMGIYTYQVNTLAAGLENGIYLINLSVNGNITSRKVVINR